MPRPRVLLCDDDREFKDAIKIALQDEYNIEPVGNGDEALQQLARSGFDIVLLDIQMRTKTEGLELLPKIKKQAPRASVIILSGLTDFNSVKTAMRLGAVDYLPKNGGLSDIKNQLKALIASRALPHEATGADLTYYNGHVLVGKSRCIEKLRDIIYAAVHKPVNTIITGEPGSGKEVVARTLGGGMRDGKPVPFVSIDSSTIPASMAESILFGHEKGAFTGAIGMKKGLFEKANGGTAYFDEIGNMSMEIQAKLLRVVQEKEFVRTGADHPLSVDFRVICATNQNIEEMIKNGQFRFDLYSRLNVLSIEIPPLRAHPEDIPLLVEHFCSKNGRALGFSNDAMVALGEYFWPGNVRELSNVVEQLCAMHPADEVGFDDLPKKIQDPDPDILPEAETAPVQNEKHDFYGQVAFFEKEILSRSYRKHKGNVSQVARELGMNRSHCHEKLTRHGIHSARSESAESA